MNGRAMSIIIVPEKEAWRIVSPLLITSHYYYSYSYTTFCYQLTQTTLLNLCLPSSYSIVVVVVVVVFLSFALNLAWCVVLNDCITQIPMHTYICAWTTWKASQNEHSLPLCMSNVMFIANFHSHKRAWFHFKKGSRRIKIESDSNAAANNTK